MSTITEKHFYNDVREAVAFRHTDCEVSLTEVTKNNGVTLTGLIVRKKDSRIAPTIYLNSLYKEWIEGNMTLSEAVESISAHLENNQYEPEFTIEDFVDWGKVKERIVYRLINADNEKYIQANGIVTRPYLDLLIQCVYYLNGQNGEIGTISINRSHLDTWGITEEDLFEAAEENTQNILPADVVNMADLLAMLGDLPLSDSMPAPPMTVVSNRTRLYGAAAIMYPGLLQQIADKEQSDLIVLPSSIHEAICLPVSENDLEEDINGMIQTVNANNVQPEEVLSDHYYLFRRESGKLEIPQTA